MKKLLKRQKQVIFFVIAGAISAVAEIGSFKLLVSFLPQLFSWENNLFGINYPVSNILATGCGFLTNYFLSIWFVFKRGKHSKKREFAYFIAVSIFSTLLSLIIFQIFFKNVFNQPLDIGFFTLSQEMISKISAIILVSILNYFVKKKYIFH